MWLAVKFRQPKVDNFEAQALSAVNGKLQSLQLQMCPGRNTMLKEISRRAGVRAPSSSIMSETVMSDRTEEALGRIGLGMSCG